MNLRVLGLSHHNAPLEVRESLAFSSEQTVAALGAWSDTTAFVEAVLLSTCNRTEFYVASEGEELPTPDQMLKFLLSCKEATRLGFPLASQFFTKDALEATEHLFSVAAGLESMVLGEVQILSQVKTAYQTALAACTVGPVTHSLFQHALKTAKRVASETELHRHRVSIPSIAVVDFAMQIFQTLTDKQVLLFGAGEMGRETLRYLVEQGTRSISMLNRSRDRAEMLAQEFHGIVVDWNDRFEALAHADVVVSTTGAPEPIVTLPEYRAIEQRRRGNPLFILDLAVPRDFESGIAECSGVYLYTIDDLREACDRNRACRDREVPKAVRIVSQDAARFVRDMNHRHGGEIIGQLRSRWNGISSEELTRLFNKLPDLEEKERTEIRYAFDRLIGKFLHPPMESLRDESENGVPHKLLDALARLFGLKGR